VTLAGAPLLRQTAAGFTPRPADEIAALLKAAYGRDIDPADVSPGLEVIAQALNRNDLGRAMVAALRLRLPDLDWAGAVRLARADQTLAKYDPNEPRDWRGRWTTSSETRPSRPTPRPARARRRGRPPRRRAGHPPKVADNVPNPSPAPAPQPLYEKLQSEFDDLDAIAFSRKVYDFGDWLSRNRQKLTPADLLNAKAQYAFLQDRLSFWLGYKYKPAAAQGALIGAAYTLYMGAVLSGLVRADKKEWPQSMNAVAVGAMAYEGSTPMAGRLRHGPEPILDEPVPIAWLGQAAANDQAIIPGNRGNAAQGAAFEHYAETQLPPGSRLAPGAWTWDFFDEAYGYAVSVKTLNTGSYTYCSNPSAIYSRLKGYVDAAATYRMKSRWRSSNVPPDKIVIRQIQLAVLASTAPEQRIQINRAILYGETRGVSVVVTRVGSKYFSQ
jgi:hypothetical protein